MLRHWFYKWCVVRMRKWLAYWHHGASSMICLITFLAPLFIFCEYIVVHLLEQFFLFSLSFFVGSARERVLVFFEYYHAIMEKASILLSPCPNSEPKKVCRSLFNRSMSLNTDNRCKRQFDEEASCAATKKARGKYIMNFNVYDS